LSAIRHATYPETPSLVVRLLAKPKSLSKNEFHNYSEIIVWQPE